MKKIITDNLYFIAGLLFGIAAILYFTGSKMTMGFSFLCLAIVFVSLGFKQKKNSK